MDATTTPSQTPAQDAGTAYGRPAATHRKDLAEVSAGTPMGELLRRYWHPVGLAADAGSTPRQVRVLGEFLIAHSLRLGLFGDGVVQFSASQRVIHELGVVFHLLRDPSLRHQDVQVMRRTG